MDSSSLTVEYIQGATPSHHLVGTDRVYVA
jgi:hypothetical protein